MRLFPLPVILTLLLVVSGCASKKKVVTTAPLPEIAFSTYPPAPLELVSKILDNLRDVHTARYNYVKKNFYGVEDTAYMGIDRGQLIECEAPADTFGVSMFVVNDPDGKFRHAYTMDYSFSKSLDNDIISMTDLRGHYMRFTDPPFFNRITRLCEYLLGPVENKTITVDDLGDEWQINATVREHMQVCFFGYPRVSTSDPYAESRFVVRVDKKSLMPTWTSYLEKWPQQRVEVSVNDVEINPYSPETFRVEDFLSEMPVYDADKMPRPRMKSVKQMSDSIKQLPLPTDPIRFATCDRTVSFPELRGKVKIILFTLEGCGACKYSYPYLSKLYDELPHDKVEMFAFLYNQANGQSEAFKSYQTRHGIRFPIANDNKMYEHFVPSRMAPVLLVIGGDDTYYLWKNGFSVQDAEKEIATCRQAIDRALSDLPD